MVFCWLPFQLESLDGFIYFVSIDFENFLGVDENLEKAPGMLNSEILDQNV